jgi:hypothetical protein
MSGPLEPRVLRLEEQLQAFGQVFSHNARVIQNAFTLQDGHTAVQYRVLNDISRGSVYKTVEGHIDLQLYHEEYAAVMCAVDFMMPVKQPEVDDSVHDRPTSPNALVNIGEFGGDYGSTNQG